jgi:hypothetical protein
VDLPDRFPHDELELRLKEWEIAGLDPVVAKAPYWEDTRNKVATALSLVTHPTKKAWRDDVTVRYVKQGDVWTRMTGQFYLDKEVSAALSAVERERWQRNRRRALKKKKR